MCVVYETETWAWGNPEILAVLELEIDLFGMPSQTEIGREITENDPRCL